MLQAGEIIRVGNKSYRVSYVNESRAFCIPLGKTDTEAADLEPGLDEPSTSKQKVKGINISPDSFVPRLSEEEAREAQTSAPKPIINKVQRQLQQEDLPMGAVQIPVGKASARQANKARLAKLRAKPVNKARPLGTSKDGKPKAVKTQAKCMCGCGELCGSFFAMGHDSTFKSRMVKIERGVMSPEELPASVRKMFEFKKRGPGYVTTKNYRGEPHNGYDGTSANIKAGKKR